MRARLFAALAALTLSCRAPTDAESAFRTVWYSPEDGRAPARPLFRDSVVITGNGAGRLTAWVARSGRVVWRTGVFSRPVGGRAILDAGDLVIAQSSFETAALDARTGSVLWRYRAPLDTVADPVSPSAGVLDETAPAVDSDAVIVPAWGGTVSAVNLASGAPEWIWTLGKLATDTAVAGSYRSGAIGVALSGDTVFVSGFHGLNPTLGHTEMFFAALDRRTGREHWRTVLQTVSAGLTVNGAPVLAPGVAIVSLQTGPLIALRRNGSGIAWEFRPPRVYSVNNPPAEVGGVLYVDGGDRGLWALDAATGARRWRVETGGAHIQLTVDGEAIYYPTVSELFVYSTVDGRSLGHTPPRGGGDTAIEGPPAFGAGIAVVNTTRGIWAFRGPR